MSKEVLIVDDEQEILDVIQLILDLRGYATLTAKSGLECLGILEEQRVDLILLDIMMPEMDGWQSVKAIKESGESWRDTRGDIDRQDTVHR